MKRSIFIVGCIMLALLLGNCSEDEVAKTYTVSVPAQFENGEVIAFITDRSGKLLDLEKGTPGSVLTLDGGNAEEITLHNVIRLKTGPTTYRYKIDSYANVPNKWNLNVLKTLPPAVTVGSHHLSVTGVPSDYNQATFVGQNVYQAPQSIIGPDVDLQAFLSKDNSQLAYLLIPPNNQTPRYASFTNASSDGHEALQFSELQEADVVDIDLGMQAEQISVDMEALYVRDFVSDAGQVAHYSIAEADHVNIYTFPNDVVSYNKTTISFYADDAYYSYYRYGGPIDKFWYIDADVTGLTASGNELKASTTGLYDYLTLRSVEDWNSELGDYILRWDIRIEKKNRKSVIIPEIPQAILNEWPELANAPIKFDYAEVVENVAHDGYLQGTSARIKTSLPPQDTKLKGRGFGSPVNPQ